MVRERLFGSGFLVGEHANLIARRPDEITPGVDAERGSGADLDGYVRKIHADTPDANND
ncbi:hypothetical protein CRBSH125_36640 [Afipia carboxidovorans]|nr:hypothetical protein CRBSH125_36640 [Afipia carboxidovorans]